MGQTPLNRADIAARRSSTWWLLARMVTEPPVDAWLVELESVVGGLESGTATPLGPESAALLDALRKARAAAGGVTALAVDRTRLLAGVFQQDSLPAPYESAALGQPMNSDRVLDVIEAYREAGFDDPAPELGPPDYLGTELRFMALLCYREMQAHQGDDSGLAPAWLARQQRFLDEHLLAWVPEHCERICLQAATPFYAALATLVARASRTDRDDVATLTAMPAQDPFTAARPETAQ